MATKIYTGDIVRFLPGPGILMLPNGSAVTCPGKYTLNAKGKHEFRAYAGDVETFTVADAPASRRGKVTTHEIGTAAQTVIDDVDDDQAAAGDKDQAGA